MSGITNTGSPPTATRSAGARKSPISLVASVFARVPRQLHGGTQRTLLKLRAELRLRWHPVDQRHVADTQRGETGGGASGSGKT